MITVWWISPPLPRVSLMLDMTSSCAGALPVQQRPMKTVPDSGGYVLFTRLPCAAQPAIRRSDDDADVAKSVDAADFDNWSARSGNRRCRTAQIRGKLWGPGPVPIPSQAPETGKV